MSRRPTTGRSPSRGGVAVTIRLSAGEHAALVARARALGVSPSAVATSAVVEAVTATPAT